MKDLIWFDLIWTIGVTRGTGENAQKIGGAVSLLNFQLGSINAIFNLNEVFLNFAWNGKK